MLAVFVDGAIDAAWGGNDYFAVYEGGADDVCSTGLLGDETCVSVDWEMVTDAERGDVLQVSYTGQNGFTYLFLGEANGVSVDLSDFETGTLSFDVKVISKGGAISLVVALENENQDRPFVSGFSIDESDKWLPFDLPIAEMTASGFDLSRVDVPFVLFPFPGANHLVYQLDNVRFESVANP
ncbi:hypothetical protein N9E29_03235 [Porticoccaceae bacterium]|nr:hypothetical protein [Porticoccaceae bacterium]